MKLQEKTLETPLSIITLEGDRRKKQVAREYLAQGYDIHARMAEYNGFLDDLRTLPAISRLDRHIKHRGSLSFEWAFYGMCYILAATNARFFDVFRTAHQTSLGNEFTPNKALACGTAFAQLMAAKEVFFHLTPEEVAGLTAATLMDTVFRLDVSEVIETSGMGGDIGFRHDGATRKTINVSTLSSLVLASLGLPAVKHGSYSNTSAVGSTECIEKFGAITTANSLQEIQSVLATSNYCFLDAHLSKTIHDLSHLLMMETINHVVGPMTAPLCPRAALTKIMGVNEKVHPEVIAQAYTILAARRILSVKGVAVVTGLDERGTEVDPSDFEAVKWHSVLDELSPFASVVSFAYEDAFLGTFRLIPEDFGVKLDPESILVNNTEAAIQNANRRALRGEDPALTDYLAMNAALGLFTYRYLRKRHSTGPTGPNREALNDCFLVCRDAIRTEKPWRVLLAYVKATGGRLDD